MRKTKCFFLFLLIFFLFSSPVLAQSFGYNIVNNFFNKDGSFNPKAFQLVARHNPGGVVTVRLTRQELQSHPNLIRLIEAAAKRYQLDLIWQPEDWGVTTPDHFRQFWLPYLSQITSGKISLFTEYNYFYGRPDYYAEILVSALKAGLQVPLATTNFNLTNPDGTNDWGRKMFQYSNFLSRVKKQCSSLGMEDCLNQVPLWAVSIYARSTSVNQAVDDFVNQLHGFTQVLASLGVSLAGKRIIIPEAGLDPSIPIKQRLALAADFINALEKRLAADPQLRGLIESATFLFMDNETGKQYLIVKDKNGKWVVLEYGSFGAMGFSGPVGGVSQNIGTAPGRSFIIKKTVCWERYDEAVKAIIRALEFNVSKNKPVANNLRGMNSLLIPPGEENKNKANESVGEVGFEVCELDTRKWFPVEDKIKVSVPSSYQQASTNGFQIAGFLNSLGELSLGIGQKEQSSFLAGNVKDQTNQKTILGETSQCPNISFRAWGEGGRLCWQIKGQPGKRSFCDWGYQITVNGKPVAGVPMLGGGGNCLVNPAGGAAVTCRDGGASSIPFSGEGKVGLRITQVHGSAGHDCRPDLARDVSCQTNEKGEIVCLDASGQVIPKPTPPLCRPRNNQGEPMAREERQTEGTAKISLKPGVSLETFKEVFARLGLFCRDVNFVFTPIVSTPFTFPEEQIQREKVYQLFSLPGDEDKYQFKHGAEPAEFGLIESSENKAETTVDIFGQRGVKDSYDYTMNLLNPPE